MTLRLHNRLPGVTTLGPGVRYCIWVQGCRRQCHGCLAPETWPLDGGEQHEVSDLAAEVLALPDLEGLTISGGEPFEQASALSELLKTLRVQRDLGVIVYTGYLLEELKSLASPENRFADLLDLTDLLIDGPYISELDDGLSLRGSSNQRVMALTNRYLDCVQSIYGAEGRRVELILYGLDASYAGIPPASFRDMWRINRKGTVG